MVQLLYRRNLYNTVNQLYFNKILQKDFISVADIFEKQYQVAYNEPLDKLNTSIKEVWLKQSDKTSQIAVEINGEIDLPVAAML